MSPTPLEVKLPVCPRCGSVARYDSTAAKIGGRIKFGCSGPAKAPHKATKMEMRLFREVLPS